MLGAMRLMVERPVPVLGVNHGNLGFLVEVTPNDLPSALQRLTAGNFSIEQYECLQTSVDRAGFTVRHGFNDVVLAPAGRVGPVSVDLTVNDLRYGYYRGDAVIVSTPIGSTAYNYASRRTGAVPLVRRRRHHPGRTHVRYQPVSRAGQ